MVINMKHKHTIIGFLSGILCAVLASTMVVPAMAALTGKTISVRTGVGIYLDGKKINPTDENGNPVETFIYNGTTYVPIRAGSNAFGVQVKYDSNTQSVRLGEDNEFPGAYLNDEYEPYLTTSSIRYEDGVKMGGKAYDHCMCFDGYFCYANYNLEGKYNTLSFDAGHIDGEGGYPTNEVKIYVDDNDPIIKRINNEDFPVHVEIKLNGAQHLKIQNANSGYAIANVYVY